MHKNSHRNDAKTVRSFFLSFRINQSASALNLKIFLFHTLQHNFFFVSFPCDYLNQIFFKFIFAAIFQMFKAAIKNLIINSLAHSIFLWTHISINIDLQYPFFIIQTEGRFDRLKETWQKIEKWKYYKCVLVLVSTIHEVSLPMLD